MKNWCFEGSNDQNTWKKLDSRSNEESLSENRASNLFEIKNQSDGDYFRYLRIRQIGLNDSNNNNICIKMFLEVSNYYEMQVIVICIKMFDIIRSNIFIKYNTETFWYYISFVINFINDSIAMIFFNF